MKYRGWIPTVTGHLSFSAIGDTVYPSKTRVLRYKKYSCFLQKRDLLDAVVPLIDGTRVGQYFREFISNWAIGVTGNFTFVCLPSQELIGESIKGQAFLISNYHRSKDVKMIAVQMKEDIGSVPEFQAKAATIVETCKSCATSSVQFTLWRNGTIEIETTESETASEENEIIDQIVADQFFFFFKDIAHTHQHHDPDHDAITRLSRWRGEDDTTWITETQNSLFRSVIRYKRFRNEKALFRASGILAYAKAFERSHRGSCKDLKVFNSEELLESLAVSREEIQHFDQKRIAYSESTKNFFFATFAFVISAVSIVQLDQNFHLLPHPVFIYVTNSVASKPIESIGIIFFISQVASYLTHRSDPASVLFVRSLVHHFQRFRMRWFYIANLATTIVLLLVFYFFLIRYII